MIIGVKSISLLTCLAFVIICSLVCLFTFVWVYRMLINITVNELKLKFASKFCVKLMRMSVILKFIIMVISKG